MTWLMLPLLLAQHLSEVPSRWAGIEGGRLPMTELRVHAQAPAWLKQSAVRAARQWCAWDRSLCLRVRIVRWGENVSVRPVIAQYGFAGLTTWWAWHEPPVIYLAEPEQLQGDLTPDEVLAHEVGHALCGCVGHPENFGLMDGRVELAAREATHDDVEMVRYFRSAEGAGAASR